MAIQSEAWVKLNYLEYGKVWNKVYKEFQFHPEYNASLNSIPPPFSFNVPVDIYDISSFTLVNNNDYERIEQTIVNSFTECIESDAYMYALDWQHTGYRYNPRITAPMPGLGFYPDGDYYFFISKNFTWGYLTHPWLEKAWVFGDRLRACFYENLDVLQFIPYENK